MLRLQRSRLRLTIGQTMMVIAVSAVALSWPEGFVIAAAMIGAVVLTLCAIFTDAGRRVAEWFVVLVTIGVLFALLQPAVVTSCGRGARTVLPNPTLQRTPRPVVR
jgi:hypothetical protein